MLGTPSLTPSSANASRISYVANQRERIKREGLPKVHHGNDRPAIGFQHLAPLAEKVPADQTGGSNERDESNQEVSRSGGHCRFISFPDYA
jgi:hypothetical protein